MYISGIVYDSDLLGAVTPYSFEGKEVVVLGGQRPQAKTSAFMYNVEAILVASTAFLHKVI